MGPGMRRHTTARCSRPSLFHRIGSRPTAKVGAERNKLRRKLRGKLPIGGAVAAVCAAGAVFGISSLASASSTSATHATKPVIRRVYMRGQSQKNPPHFVAPKSVHVGDKLKIINQTDPSTIGPHRFALVKQQFIRSTHKEQRRCFRLGQICRSMVHGS